MTKLPLDLSLPGLLSLVWTTIRKPRDVGRQIINMAVPSGTLWLILATVATVSILIGQVASLLLVPEAQQIDGLFLASPLLMAAIQWGILLVSIYAVYHIGRLMGGAGTFDGVLSLMTWLQVVMIVVQVLQTAVMFLAPGLTELVTVIGIVVFMWVFTSFVAESHGFANLALVFVMILVSTLAISFALTLVLAVLGINFSAGGAGV